MKKNNKKAKTSFLKKAIGFLLASVLVLSAIPVAALDDDAGQQTSQPESTSMVGSTSQSAESLSGSTSTEPEKVTVRFFVNGTLYSEQEIDAGSQVVFPQEPAGEKGIAFAGWFADGETEAYSAERPVDASMNLHARFNEKYVTITYFVGGTAYQTQQVVENTLVKFPDDPQPGPGEYFLGWYTEGGTLFDPRTIASADTGLYAKFGNAFIIKYMNTDGRILETAELEPGDAVMPPAARPTLDNGQSVLYWYEEGQPDVKYVFEQGADKNLVLYPYIEGSAMLIFDAQGYEVEPMVLVSGSTGEEPAPPLRAGYTFLHWSEEPDGSKYAFTEPIYGVKTLYAVWKGTTVSYVINYWNEKKNVSGTPDPQDPADLDKYELVYTKSMANGTAGQPLTFDAATANTNYRSGGTAVTLVLDYSDFVYSETEVLLGSGTTVINVYYNRTLFEFRFSLTPNNASTRRLKLFYGNGTEEYPLGTAYNVAEYVIQFKVEQDVTGLFPYHSEVFDINDNALPSFTPMNWSGRIEYYANGTAAINSNGIIALFTSGRAGRPTATQKSVILTQRVVSGSLFTHIRYYYGEMLREDWPDSAVTDDELAALGIKRFTTKGTTDTRYYQYITETRLLHSENSPLSGAGSWPGNAFAGYQQIITTLTSKYQQVDYVSPNYEGMTGTKGHYSIDYFMPRLSFAFSLNPNGGSFEEAGDGFTYSGSNLVRTMMFEETIPAPLPQPSRTGYKFLGWFTDEACTNPYILGTMPANTQMLYAGWEGLEVNVQYMDGIEKIGSKSYGYGQWVTTHEALKDTDYYGLAAGDVVEGKGIFRGWYYDIGAENTVSLPFPTELCLTKNEYILRAKWEPKECDVLFYDGINLDTTIAEYTLRPAPDNTLALSGLYMPVTVRAGYSLSGWQTAAGKPFTAASRILENTDIYAIWRPNAYAVSYDNNGGNGTLLPGRAVYDAPFTLSGVGGLYKVGHTFAGWNSSKEQALLGQVEFEGGYLIDRWSIAENTVFYAVWMPNLYTVTYNGNGGESTSLPPVLSQQLLYGETFEIYAQGPTKTGHAFKGWQNSFDRQLYAANSSFEIPADDVELVAQWHEIGTPELVLENTLILLDTTAGADILLPDGTTVSYEEFCGLDGDGFLQLVQPVLNLDPEAGAAVQVQSISTDFEVPAGGFVPGHTTNPQEYSFTVTGLDTNGKTDTKTVWVRVVDSTAPVVVPVGDEVVYRNGSNVDFARILEDCGGVQLSDDYADEDTLQSNLVSDWDPALASVTGIHRVGLETADTAGNTGQAGLNVRIWDEIAQAEDIAITTAQVAAMDAEKYIWLTGAAGAYYSGRAGEEAEPSVIADIDFSKVKNTPGKYPVAFATQKGTVFGCMVTVVPAAYTARIVLANGQPDETRLVEENTLVPFESVTPQYAGHTFAGWTLDDGSAWDFVKNTMPQRNIVITAHWTPNPVVTPVTSSSPESKPPVSSRTSAPGESEAAAVVSSAASSSQSPQSIAEKPEDLQIEKGDVPLSQTLQKHNHWALANLILSVLTLVVSVLALVAFRKSEEHDAAKKAGRIWRILAVLVGLAAVVLFFITQDLRSAMVFADKITVFHLILFVLQPLLFALLALAKRRRGSDEQNDESGAPA